MIISVYSLLDKGLLLAVEIQIRQLSEVYNNFFGFINLSHFAQWIHSWGVPLLMLKPEELDQCQLFLLLLF